MSFQLKPVIDAVQSRCTTAVDTAQEALTSGRAEVNSRYAQLKENATTEKVKENYEHMIVEVKTRLDSLLNLMKELVEATQTEAKTFERSKEALDAAQKKVQLLIVKFEALLKDLQKKMGEVYVAYIPEERRQEINKFLEGATKQLSEGLLQVKDVYKEKELQGVAQFGKVVEWASEKSNEVQTKVSELTDEHVKPRFESAKEVLTNYSPDAMEKANEGFSALMDEEQTYFARLTAFLYIIFQAVIALATTKPVPEESTEEICEEMGSVRSTIPEPIEEEATVSAENTEEQQEEEQQEFEIQEKPVGVCDSPVGSEDGAKKSPDSAPKTPKTSTHS